MSAGKRVGRHAGRQKPENCADCPVGAPRQPASPLPQLPAYPLQPSRYAPVRKGLVSRSIPTVVSGP
jgi:hypothetical protein